MLRQRALSSAVFVPPLVVVLILGEPWLRLVVFGFVALGSWEAFGLLGRAGYRAAPVLGVGLALVVSLATALVQATDTAALLLVSAALLLAAVAAFAERDTSRGLGAWIGLLFGAAYLGQLGFLVRLGEIAPALPPAAPLAWFGAARGWTLLVVLVVWTFDTAAYLVGRTLGRRTFLSHISPSKSYWGLAGGLAGAALVGVAGCWALGQPAAAGLLLGPLVALAAQAGDLAESLLKRAAGAKDSGTFVPGHGGILDRIDSFLFAAPIATLYVATLVR